MELTVKLKGYDWAILIATIALFINGLIFTFFGRPSILSICAIAINFLFIIKFYRSIPLFILFVFIFFYTKTFSYYFLDGIPISFWSDFQTPSVLVTVLVSHVLFLLFLGNLIPSNSVNNLDISKFFNSDIIVFFILYVISIIILIFGMRGETVFQSGSYGNSQSVEKSTLHEYFILTFLLSVLFSPKGRIYVYAIFSLLLAYIFKTLLYGGRIEVIQILLLYFYINYVFKDKIKVWQVVLLVLLGVYINEIIGNIRSHPNDFLIGNLDSILYPGNFFFNRNDVEMIASNEGDVIQSSARLIGLVETSNLNFFRRISSFLSYLMAPIVPSALLPEYANLASYKQDLYRSGGGGLISTYFFVWLGYLGPIIIGIIIAFFIRTFYQFKNRFFIVYGLSLLVTFPRWFAYNPVFLLKFCVYAVVLLFAILEFKKLIKKKIRKNP